MAESSSAKGFAGLVSLVSDIDVAVGDQDGKETATHEGAPASARDVAGDQSNTTKIAGEDAAGQNDSTGRASEPRKWEVSTEAWVLGIFGFAVVAALLFSGLGGGSSQQTDYSGNKAGVSGAGGNSQQKQAQWDAANKPPQTKHNPFDEFDSKPDRERTDENNWFADLTKNGGSHRLLTYTKPPTGEYQVLSVPEIRWCLRERIRLNVFQKLSNNNAQIRKYNRFVAIYNSRCGRFKYRRGDLARAKRQVLDDEDVIVSRALEKDAHSLGISKARGASDLVYEIQFRLKNQGYNPGPIDGLFGSSTRSAIIRYERRHGYPATGTPTKKVLALLRAHSAVSMNLH